MRRTFEWRDPVYKDMNTDAEEYDDYHLIDRIETPFTITRYKNDDMIANTTCFTSHITSPWTLISGAWTQPSAASKNSSVPGAGIRRLSLVYNP